MSDKRKLVTLHFDEEFCCYGDDPMKHDVLIIVNPTIDMCEFLEKVDEVKHLMDSYDYVDEDDEDYDENDAANARWKEINEEYEDYGWHEKIEYAIDIVAKENPEYAITRIESGSEYPLDGVVTFGETVEYEIN